MRRDRGGREERCKTQRGKTDGRMRRRSMTASTGREVTGRRGGEQEKSVEKAQERWKGRDKGEYNKGWLVGGLSHSGLLSFKASELKDPHCRPERICLPN